MPRFILPILAAVVVGIALAWNPAPRGSASVGAPGGLLPRGDVGPPPTSDEAMLDGAMQLEGQTAPDFRLASLDGEEIGLADHRGKVVVLNFFASWCGPCNIEAPDLEQNFWRQFGGDGLVVIGVNVGEEGDPVIAAREFQKQHQLTYPILVDRDSSVQQQYSAFVYPTTFVIDRDGKIVRTVLGYDPAAIHAAVASLGVG